MAGTDFGGTPTWAASWDRSRLDRNDDWYGLAAITTTHVIIAQPKETDQSSRTLQSKAHQLLNSASAPDEPLRGLSVSEQLIRSCSNSLIFERSEVLGIKALAAGNMLRIFTTGGVHLVGSFSHKSDVTRIATNLAAILWPASVPRTVAQPRLTGDLVRYLAKAPAVAAGFFALALGLRVAIDDRSRSVTSRGKNGAVEGLLQAIPIPVLAALGLLVVALLVMRIRFRAKNEVWWSLTEPAASQGSLFASSTASPGSLAPQPREPQPHPGLVTEF